MAKFLIEVSHESDKLACQHAIDIFLSSGNHFISNADWGCLDGEHKAWITIELESKDEALQILPPAYRSFAKIIHLTKFDNDAIDDLRHRM